MVCRVAIDVLHLSTVVQFRIVRIKEVGLLSCQILIFILVVLVTYLGRQVVVIAKYIAVSQNLVEVGSRSVVASFCTTTTERLSVTDERSVEYCLATVREIITVVCCKLEILQERDFQIRA